MFIFQIAFLFLFNNFHTKALQLDIFRNKCWNITEDNLIKNCTKQLQECICCNFIKNEDTKENCTKNCCEYKKEKFLNNHPLNVNPKETNQNNLTNLINKMPIINIKSINKLKRKLPTVKKKILTHEMVKALHKLVHKRRKLGFNKKIQKIMPNISNNQTENIDYNNFSIPSSPQKMDDGNLLPEIYTERKFPSVRLSSNFTSYTIPKFELKELTMKMRPNLILTTSSESLKKKEPISPGSNFSFSESNLIKNSMLDFVSENGNDYHKNLITENGLSNKFSKNGMDFYRSTIFDRNHNIVEMNLDNEKIEHLLSKNIDNNNMDKASVIDYNIINKIMQSPNYRNQNLYKYEDLASNNFAESNRKTDQKFALADLNVSSLYDEPIKRIFGNHQSSEEIRKISKENDNTPITPDWVSTTETDKPLSVKNLFWKRPLKKLDISLIFL